jgi:ribosomal protein S18 acetylase RimI-like enzyme
MNLTQAKTHRMLTVRSMEMRDLPRLLQIEKQTGAPHWTQYHFKTVLRAGDRINLVATIKNSVVGFAISRLISDTDLPGEEASGTGLGPSGATGVISPAVYLRLLHVAVAADWRRQGIGYTLIKQFDQFLRLPEDSVRAAVPETNLSTQLLLRSAGYRAVRVLRGFYACEDAYLMERHRGS